MIVEQKLTLPEDENDEEQDRKNGDDNQLDFEAASTISTGFFLISDFVWLLSYETSE